jgi:CRISPR/Cas system-associated endonuclease Cas3-HD
LANTLLRFALSLYPKFLFNNLSAFGNFEKATKIFVDITKANWISYSLPEEGMTLVLNRFGEAAVAKLIIKSLKETASTNEN